MKSGLPTKHALGIHCSNFKRFWFLQRTDQSAITDMKLNAFLEPGMKHLWIITSSFWASKGSCHRRFWASVHRWANLQRNWWVRLSEWIRWATPSMRADASVLYLCRQGRAIGSTGEREDNVLPYRRISPTNTNRLSLIKQNATWYVPLNHESRKTTYASWIFKLACLIICWVVRWAKVTEREGSALSLLLLASTEENLGSCRDTDPRRSWIGYPHFQGSLTGYVLVVANS